MYTFIVRYHASFCGFQWPLLNHAPKTYPFRATAPNGQSDDMPRSTIAGPTKNGHVSSPPA